MIMLPHIRNRIVQIILIIFLVQLSGCSLVQDCCSENTRRQLIQARNKFDKQEIDDYSFIYREICFCIFRGPVEVVVRDRQIVSATVVETGVQLSQEEITASFYTISELFERLLQIEASNPVQFDLTIDPVYSYPSQAYIDFDRGIADEEWGFKIESFQPHR